MNYGFLKDKNGNKIYINDNSIYHEGKNLSEVINSKQDKLIAGTQYMAFPYINKERRFIL